MATATIESVFESIDSRADGHEEAYRQFVFALVEGTAKLNGHTEINVTRTGRTLDTLRADVETYRKRLAAIEQLNAAKELRIKHNIAWKEFCNAQGEAQTFEDETKKKIESRWEEVSDLKYKAESLEFEAREVQGPANAALSDTYDPAIDQEIQSLDASLLGLRREFTLTEEEFRKHLGWIESKRREYRDRNGGEACTEEELDRVHPKDGLSSINHRKTQLEQQIKNAESRIGTLKAMRLDIKQMKWATKS